MFLLFTLFTLCANCQLCCEANADKIIELENLLQAIENDLDDLFRAQFNIIDDRIIDIEKQLIELELRADQADRNILITESQANRLEDDVINGTDQIGRIEKLVFDNIFILIRDFGINIGTWGLKEDTNNNFRFIDQRGGSYRMLRTGTRRNVRSVII